MNKISIKDILVKIDDNRDILPTSISMFKVAEIDSTLLVSYKNKINTITKNYDFIIVDCPPSLSMYSRLGLMLADRLFMPVESSDESYKAINDAIETTRVLTVFNPNLENFKVFEARSQKNRSIDAHYREVFKEELGDKWLEISVPQMAFYKERSSQIFNFFEKIKKPEMENFFDYLYQKEIL